MRFEGWLLDVRLQDDEALIWVKTQDQRIEFRARYYPDFYVIPDKVSFNEFIDLFDEHPHIPSIDVAERFTSISDIERQKVLRVSVDSVEQFKPVVHLVEKYGEVFDSDLSHTQRFLADHGLVPFVSVIIVTDEHNKVQSIEQVPLDLSVPPPPFKVLCFEILSDDGVSFVTYDEGMREEYSFSGAEEDSLSDFLEYLGEVDPDLISCVEADLKKLLKLCLKYRKPVLGVYQRKSFDLSGGRVFISLISYRRMSLAGMVERIQYTREVPRIGSECASGRAIESRQCYEARRRGYLLPRLGFYQPVMSLEELLRERDHGGLIFAPTVGLHENVAALDFESMFPHLILKNNISYENVRGERESEGFLLDFTRETLDRRLF